MPDSQKKKHRTENNSFPTTASFHVNDQSNQSSERANGHSQKKIGPYQLISLLGEGGMGSVWLANQTEPIKRQVAIKTIQHHRQHQKQIIARFEAERQALAMMDHRNIAKVLDAGISDEFGPYFVMEYCKGRHITKFCAKHKLNLDQRLRLFVQVCNAVQHAHQKGIIHRDLKPSNIIIVRQENKVVPKVIDFGLVKAIQPDVRLTEKTLFSQAGIGTYKYMSPEQVGANPQDIDTRADVYALGTLLYELLTGTTPIRGKELQKQALDEVYRIIREQDPPKPSERVSASGLDGPVEDSSVPSSWKSSLENELDWIVMKSLEKERESRYRTVEALAADISNFLHGNPVAARPPSTWYQLRKFMARNRRLAGSLAAIAATILIAFACVSLLAWKLSVAEKKATVAFEQQNKALNEAERARDNLATVNEQLEINQGKLKTANQEANQAARLATSEKKKAVASAEIARKETEKAKQSEKEKLKLVGDLKQSILQNQELLDRACNLAILRGRQAWSDNDVQDAISQFCFALRLDRSNEAAKYWLFHAIESHATKGWHPPRQVIGGEHDDVDAIMAQNGKHVTVQKTDGRLNVFRHINGSFELESEIEGLEGTLFQIYIQNSRRLFFYGTKERFVLAKESNAKLIPIQEFQFPEIHRCRFSENGRYLIVTTNWSQFGGSVLIDTRSGKKIYTSDSQFFVSPNENSLVEVGLVYEDDRPASEKISVNNKSRVTRSIKVTVRKLPSLEVDGLDSTRPPMPEDWEPESGSGFVSDSDGVIKLKATDLEVPYYQAPPNLVFLANRRGVRKARVVISFLNNLVGMDLDTGFYTSEVVESSVNFLSRHGKPISVVDGENANVSIEGSEFETGHIVNIESDDSDRKFLALSIPSFGGNRLFALPNQNHEFLTYNQLLSPMYISGAFVNKYELLAKFSKNSFGLWDVPIVAIEKVELPMPGGRLSFLTEHRNGNMVFIDSQNLNGGTGLFEVDIFPFAKNGNKKVAQSQFNNQEKHLTHSQLVEYRFQKFDPMVNRPVGAEFVVRSNTRPNLSISKSGVLVIEISGERVLAFDTHTGRLLMEEKESRFLGFDHNGRLLIARHANRSSIYLIDVSDGREPIFLYSSNRNINSAALSPKSDEIATLDNASMSLRVRYGPDFDEASALTIDFKNEGFFPNEVTYSPGGKLLISGSGRGFSGRTFSYADGSVRTYDPTLRLESEVFGAYRIFGKQLTRARTVTGEFCTFDLQAEKPRSVPRRDEKYYSQSNYLFVNQDSRFYGFYGSKTKYSRGNIRLFSFRDLDLDYPISPELWTTGQGLFDVVIPLQKGIRVFTGGSFFDVPSRKGLFSKSAPIAEEVIEWAEAFAAKSAMLEGVASEISPDERLERLSRIELPEGPWKELRRWLEKPVPKRSFYPLTGNSLQTPTFSKDNGGSRKQNRVNIVEDEPPRPESNDGT